MDEQTSQTPGTNSAPAGAGPTPTPPTTAGTDSQAPQHVGVRPTPVASVSTETPTSPQVVTDVRPATVDPKPSTMPVVDSSQLKSRNRRWWVVAAVAVLLLAGLGGFYYWNQEQAWKQATVYFEKAEYDQAAQKLKGLPMPSSPERLKVYAQTMLATRQFDSSLTAYQKLQAIKPTAETKLTIGNIYNEKKQPVEAERLYGQVIAEDPSNVQAYTNLVTLYRLQGKADQARQTLNQAVAKNPKSVTLHELRVTMLLDQKGSADFKQAVEALRKLSPTDPLLTTVAR